MDILALNNELIKLRAKFQVAKRIALLQLKKNIINLQKQETTSAAKRPEIHELHKQIEHIKCTHLDEIMKLAFMYQPPAGKKRRVRLTTHDLVHARIFKIMKSKIEPLRTKYKLDVGKNMFELKRRWLEKLEKNRLIRRSKENKKMRKEGNAAKLKRMEWLKEHGLDDAPKEPSVKKVDEKLPKGKSKLKPARNSEWTVEDVESGLDEPAASGEKIADDANVDSFFLTNSGENYVSSFVTAKKEPNPYNKHNNPPHRQKQFAQNGKTFNRPNAGGSSQGQNRKRLPNERAPKQKSSNTKTTPAVATDLHPSWAAKMNAKPLVSDFQGKKIVFDD